MADEIKDLKSGIINDKIKEPNNAYKRMTYSRQQMRDTVEGSNAVKRKKEMYLPMPAGFLLQDDVAAISRSRNDSLRVNKNIFNIDVDLPWWSDNPAFRTYLQRARFPDITSRSLDALQGIATNKTASFELGDFKNLEEKATQDGQGIIDLYAFLVIEVLSQGKIALVVDVDEKTNEFYLIVYLAESNINWKYECDALSGRKYLTKAVFIQVDENYSDGDCEYVEYCYDGEVVVANHYDKDCKLILNEDGDNSIKRLGKSPDNLPVFFIGSKENTAENDHIPLLGISDIALSIYQKDADLTHAEHLTCSPTLFMYGFDEGNRPSVVGGGVGVTNTNVNAHAEYTTTDTSGLQHVKSRMETMFEEAAAYGATIVGTNQVRNEKFETAKLRNFGTTSTLINVCRNVGKTLEDILKFMQDWSDKKNSKISFEPNLDFSEHNLDAGELTALMGMYIQNGISQDTFLFNLMRAGKLPEGATVEDEKKKIQDDINNELLNLAKDNANLKLNDGKEDGDEDKADRANK